MPLKINYVGYKGRPNTRYNAIAKRMVDELRLQPMAGKHTRSRRIVDGVIQIEVQVVFDQVYIKISGVPIQSTEEVISLRGIYLHNIDLLLVAGKDDVWYFGVAPLASQLESPSQINWTVPPVNSPIKLKAGEQYFRKGDNLISWRGDANRQPLIVEGLGVRDKSIYRNNRVMLTGQEYVMGASLTDDFLYVIEFIGSVAHPYNSGSLRCVRYPIDLSLQITGDLQVVHPPVPIMVPDTLLVGAEGGSPVRCGFHFNSLGTKAVGVSFFFKEKIYGYADPASNNHTSEYAYTTLIEWDILLGFTFTRGRILLHGQIPVSTSPTIDTGGFSIESIGSGTYFKNSYNYNETVTEASLVINPFVGTITLGADFKNDALVLAEVIQPVPLSLSSIASGNFGSLLTSEFDDHSTNATQNRLGDFVFKLTLSLQLPWITIPCVDTDYSNSVEYTFNSVVINHDHVPSHNPKQYEINATGSAVSGISWPNAVRLLHVNLLDLREDIVTYTSVKTYITGSPSKSMSKVGTFTYPTVSGFYDNPEDIPADPPFQIGPCTYEVIYSEQLKDTLITHTTVESHDIGDALLPIVQYRLVYSENGEDRNIELNYLTGLVGLRSDDFTAPPIKFGAISTNDIFYFEYGDYFQERSTRIVVHTNPANQANNLRLIGGVGSISNDTTVGKYRQALMEVPVGSQQEADLTALLISESKWPINDTIPLDPLPKLITSSIKFTNYNPNIVLEYKII